jgi:hypothetical protein
MALVSGVVWKNELTFYDNIDDENTQLELFTLLSLNRNKIKSVDARRKDIRALFNDKSAMQKLLDLNLGNAMLQLLSWIGREDVELCLMYDFLLKTPSLFGSGSVNKRKRQEL